MGHSRLEDTGGRPLRDLRISVTDRCNLRCPYCMPAEIFGEGFRFLPRSEILTFEEITRLTRIFVDLGVTKVRITGGEPLLRSDLPDLIRALARIEGISDLTLTTNGLLLPSLAVALKEAGLSRVTVSLDSLDPQVFRAMSGRDASPDAVLAGIDAAVAAGLSPIKVNCVVQRGVNDHTLVDLARHFRGTGHILRFIEFMDVGTRNAWDMAQVVLAGEILERIGSQFPLRAEEPNYPGEVARRYHYTDGAGEIGLIASVSAPFCGSCTRGRLSTKGGFVTCLFASEGLDLRTPLRGDATDEDLRALIAARWASRDDRYSEERRPEGTPTRGRIEMFQLGG